MASTPGRENVDFPGEALAWVTASGALSVIRHMFPGAPRRVKTWRRPGGVPRGTPGAWARAVKIHREQVGTSNATHRAARSVKRGVIPAIPGQPAPGFTSIARCVRARERSRDRSTTWAPDGDPRSPPRQIDASTPGRGGGVPRSVESVDGSVPGRWFVRCPDLRRLIVTESIDIRLARPRAVLARARREPPVRAARVRLCAATAPVGR